LFEKHQKDAPNSGPAKTAHLLTFFEILYTFFASISMDAKHVEFSLKIKKKDAPFSVTKKDAPFWRPKKGASF